MVNPFCECTGYEDCVAATTPTEIGENDVGAWFRSSNKGYAFEFLLGAGWDGGYVPEFMKSTLASSVLLLMIELRGPIFGNKFE